MTHLHLLLTVRFLDARYHGLIGRDGMPEWPPSPFRLFQALVAGVARRGELVIGEDVPENKSFTPIGQALGWLQKHTCNYPPVIVAPRSQTGRAIVRYGPDNDGDNEKFQENPETFRTGKYTKPTLFILEPDQKSEVHYIWDIATLADVPNTEIRDAARSLTSLGWGIDMAFADVRVTNEIELLRQFELVSLRDQERIDASKRKWIVWYPKPKTEQRDEGMLRTPTYDPETGDCTLCDLRHCHSTFINRIEHGKPLHTVDKPKIFDRILYTSTECPIGRPYRLFRITYIGADGEEIRRGYPHAQLIHLAGMLRHKAIQLMQNFRDPVWLESFVAGHNCEHSKHHKQFSYIPLPTIGHPQADALIRRVMILAPFGEEAALNHLANQLDGAQLKSEHNGPRPLLERIHSDNVIKNYLALSTDWHTVTPVILPGHDDHKPAKTHKLILAALHHSGIEQPCTFTFSPVPNFKHTLSAYTHNRKGEHIGYFRPNHLEGKSAVHLQLHFSEKVPGPLCIGAGRHYGFGLLAIPPS